VYDRICPAERAYEGGISLRGPDGGSFLVHPASALITTILRTAVERITRLREE
jgi:hypothetical protein